MKIAFIYGKQPSSTLTKFFTGSACYHVGFTNGVPDEVQVGWHRVDGVFVPPA